jgi:hypothetical protein
MSRLTRIPRRALGLAVILCSLLFVAATIAAAVDPANGFTAHVVSALAIGAPIGIKALGLHAMVIIPWQPAKTRDDLEAIINPQQANQPEVVPWQLYDTQDIANAAAGPFTFFVNQNADKTLSNMEGPGQLPDPQFFECYYLSCDILQVPAATAQAAEPNTALANVENILKTCRATFTFNMSNKRYGPFSLTMAHATGGATGSGYGYGTAANGTSAFLVNNGIPGSGGFPFSGALVIPPKTGFDVTVNLGVAATILVATVKMRISLVGNLYRRVL